MARLLPRVATPVSTLLLGLLAGCASNTPGYHGGGSGSSGAGGSGSASGGSSGGGGGTGASMSGTGANSDAGCGVVPGPTTPPAADAAVNAAQYCKVKVPANCAGSLPFVVDTAYVPSGWMGDAPFYAAMPADPTLGLPAAPERTSRMQLAPTGYTNPNKDACTGAGVGRSSPNAQGGCWQIKFTPFPKTVQPGAAAGSTKIGGGPGYGWAGAFWQYPQNNWGGLGGGYPIPSGANTVSFWAKGSVGGESVRFFTGQGLNMPCADYVNATSLDVHLDNPPAWKQYKIDITGLDYTTPNPAGGYYGGVLGAFGFGVGDQVLTPDGGGAPPNETDPTAAPVADPAVPGKTFPPFFDSTVVFYIDDIEFQK